MRRFAIPKPIYILLVLVLGVLSIGYTYAYFSSTYQASANLQMGKIDILWYDMESFQEIAKNSIAITSEELDAGEFSKIQAPTEDQSAMRDSSLGLLNYDASVAIYCRIKIEANYIPKGEVTPIDCGDKWVQLAYQDGTNDPEVIEGNGWFYDNGYYYYGSDNGTTKTLTGIDAGRGRAMATHVYLDPSVDAKIYGSSIAITLIAEAVQTTNKAYQSVWGVTW